MALWGVQYFLQKVVGGKLNSVMSPCEGEKILKSLRKLFVKFLKNVEHGEKVDNTVESVERHCCRKGR